MPAALQMRWQSCWAPGSALYRTQYFSRVWGKSWPVCMLTASCFWTLRLSLTGLSCSWLTLFLVLPAGPKQGFLTTCFFLHSYSSPRCAGKKWGSVLGSLSRAHINTGQCGLTGRRELPAAPWATAVPGRLVKGPAPPSGGKSLSFYLMSSSHTTLLHADIHRKSPSTFGESHKGSLPHPRHADQLFQLASTGYPLLPHLLQSCPQIYSSALPACTHSQGAHRNLLLSLSFFVGPSSPLHLSTDTSKTPEEWRLSTTRDIGNHS